MSKPTDVKVVGAALYLLPVKMRVPLKFGSSVTTEIVCALVKVTVADAKNRRATGWGETPLAVQWSWPSATMSPDARLHVFTRFCKTVAEAWAGFNFAGHPIEISHAFHEQMLPGLLGQANQMREGQDDSEPMPWLAALIAFASFDIALHDAYGNLHKLPVYQTYTKQFLSEDLSAFLTPIEGSGADFIGKYPDDFLAAQPVKRLRAWHLVGGADPLTPGHATDAGAAELNDGHPVFLSDWIKRDGLKCLKIKLRGNDAQWDYQRLVDVGTIAVEHNVDWLSTDFNCTVTDPQYVNESLDRLRDEHPRIFGMILYVEQPFPYDLEANQIDVHSVSARKPLFMDESAHDWKFVKLGRQLGWSGVALKTCKTQTGALLTCCWAKAHGMPLMVQDLTNPMLAIIPHALLAAHAGTIMGVEVNAAQFYPDASAAEQQIHPGLYQRRNGEIDLSTLQGPGFGYRIEEINRELPQPECVF